MTIPQSLETTSALEDDRFKSASVENRAHSDELATWFERVLAKLIDSAVVWIPFTILWFLAAHLEETGKPTQANAFYVLSYVEAVIGWFWTIYQTGTTGQSIGKRLVHIRIVSETDNQPVGFGQAFLHETAQLLLDVPPLLLGYLWPLIDKKRQTFSDKVSKTKTIRFRPTQDTPVAA